MLKRRCGIQGRRLEILRRRKGVWLPTVFKPDDAAARGLFTSSRSAVSAVRQKDAFTQPSLTKHIRNVEEALGAKIVDRSSRSLALTPRAGSFTIMPDGSSSSG